MHLITKWRISVSFLTLLISAPVFADYITEMDQAAWHFKKTSASCQIEHKITDVALARFSSKAGGPLVFELNWLTPSPQGGQVTLTAIGPPWQHLDTQTLGRSTWQQQSLRFTHPASLALEALVAGRWLNITESARPHSFILSNIYFQDAYNAFRLCRGNSGGVEQTLDGQQLTLHFQASTQRLTEAQTAQLTTLAQRMSTSPSVSGLLIESFTDNSGSAALNLRLSRERGELVIEQLRRHLLLLPMDLKAHGQAFPLNDNRTPAERYQNRRVTITLLQVEQAS